ncbi:MAG: GNAT family N-acetyltransferase [Rhodospirillales bacterium]|nr:GNAT family N-acetyltransferase [Rhodospirillales bacterium]
MQGNNESTEDGLVIRVAAKTDIAAVSRLDTRVTGMTKPEYWADMFERYGKRTDRHFLIAEDISQAGTRNGDGLLVGFIIGEVRAWEFGSPPSGWIFAIGVDPDARLHKTGSRLFKAMCQRLTENGVDTVRTMLAREDELVMAFFRSQGMMAGPFVELEMPLDGIEKEVK